MTLEVAIREALRAALLAELPLILTELRGHDRLVPIKKAPIAYRAILDAEKRGELKVYRIGHASFVDSGELETFIRREGAPPPAPSLPPDEIAELIAFNEARKKPPRKKKRRAAERRSA